MKDLLTCSPQDKTLEFDECVKITITELLCGENGPRAAEEYIQEVIETKVRFL